MVVFLGRAGSEVFLRLALRLALVFLRVCHGFVWSFRKFDL